MCSLITLLITLQNRYVGMPFLSVFSDRADGSNPTAQRHKVYRGWYGEKVCEIDSLIPIYIESLKAGERAPALFYGQKEILY